MSTNSEETRTLEKKTQGLPKAKSFTSLITVFALSLTLSAAVTLAGIFVTQELLRKESAHLGGEKKSYEARVLFADAVRDFRQGSTEGSCSKMRDLISQHEQGIWVQKAKSFLSRRCGSI